MQFVQDLYIQHKKDAVSIGMGNGFWLIYQWKEIFIRWVSNLLLTNLWVTLLKIKDAQLMRHYFFDFLKSFFEI